MKRVQYLFLPVSVTVNIYLKQFKWYMQQYYYTDQWVKLKL